MIGFGSTITEPFIQSVRTELRTNVAGTAHESHRRHIHTICCVEQRRCRQTVANRVVIFPTTLPASQSTICTEIIANMRRLRCSAPAPSRKVSPGLWRPLCKCLTALPALHILCKIRWNGRVSCNAKTARRIIIKYSRSCSKHSACRFRIESNSAFPRTVLLGYTAMLSRM